MLIAILWTFILLFRNSRVQWIMKIKPFHLGQREKDIKCTAWEVNFESGKTYLDFCIIMIALGSSSKKVCCLASAKSHCRCLRELLLPFFLLGQT